MHMNDLTTFPQSLSTTQQQPRFANSFLITAIAT